MSLPVLYLYRAVDFPHGFRCPICDHLFTQEGEPYVSVPIIMDIFELRCFGCRSVPT